MIKQADTDPVLAWVREAVASLTCIGPGKGRQIAPAAHLSRLGIGAAGYCALTRTIQQRWGVLVHIPTGARVEDVAELIVQARAGVDAPVLPPVDPSTTMIERWWQ